MLLSTSQSYIAAVTSLSIGLFDFQPNLTPSHGSIVYRMEFNKTSSPTNAKLTINWTQSSAIGCRGCDMRAMSCWGDGCKGGVSLWICGV